MRKLGPLLAALMSLAALAWPASSLATFHEMSIREVYAGSPESQYVELQMWAAGQNLVEGHVLKTYNAGGGLTSTNTFASDVPNGANQSTILLATPAVETEFEVTADTALAVGRLDPTGGAVCWENLDCVSWGGFSGFAGTAPSPVGSPAAAIPAGMALRRTIAPGCATLLEPTDDHDNSAADFSAVFPAPRPNSVAPSERRCPGSSEGGFGGGSGGSAQKGAPQTRLRRKPGKKISDRTPTFRFGSSESGSVFQCKLDGKSFRSCRSPFTTKPLALGHHSFKVRARDDSGRLDPSPASYGFKVIAKT
ncbi:MAG: large repetitive protein [Solirubrobacterales bacterium]|jgi:hypothetical protein|nr:large repetitive protein [Solirubrobacterales bacterium]